MTFLLLTKYMKGGFNQSLMELPCLFYFLYFKDMPSNPAVVHKAASQQQSHNLWRLSLRCRPHSRSPQVLLDLQLHLLQSTDCFETFAL